MNSVEVFRTMLLLLLVICAIAVNLTPNLLQAVIIFLSYSSIMCVIWVLLRSPDLAITEAAVGAGISGILFLMTLRKIRTEDAGETTEEDTGMVYDSQAAKELEDTVQLAESLAQGSADGEEQAERTEEWKS